MYQTSCTQRKINHGEIWRIEKKTAKQKEKQYAILTNRFIVEYSNYAGSKMYQEEIVQFPHVIL